MQIIILGTTDDENSEEIHLLIEYQGDSWLLRANTTKPFIVTDLEKAINILKKDSPKV